MGRARESGALDGETGRKLRFLVGKNGLVGTDCPEVRGVGGIEMLGEVEMDLFAGQEMEETMGGKGRGVEEGGRSPVVDVEDLVGGSVFAGEEHVTKGKYVIPEVSVGRSNFDDGISVEIVEEI